MSFLLINLMVLAVVAAAGLFAYAQLQSCGADDWFAPAPSIDYGALQAQWRGAEAVHDWESLKAQVRRWQESGPAGAAPVPCEEVARNLNDAVFRFAVPGDALVPGQGAGAGGGNACPPCPARQRARGRPWF